MAGASTCAIGNRPIDLHLRGFEALGAKITLEHGNIVAIGDNLKGAEFSLEGEFGSSVGATCNVLMAAVLTPGRTIIHGAAHEPEVGELARMLNLMGARVIGIDSPTLEIEGVEALRPITYTTIPDRIEAATYLVAGAIPGNDVLALGARACMAGRAYLYGLGAGGERGVDHALDLLATEFHRVMTLTGVRSVADIGPELVRWREGGP